jgi:hypothetical protein
MSDVRTWITARLDAGGKLADGEDGIVVTIDVHADKDFGTRSATAHVSLDPESNDRLVAALTEALREAEDDVVERVDEAALLHRINLRDHGVDWKSGGEYVGPEVTVEDAVYSDPGVMQLPPDQRERALTMAVADREELIAMHAARSAKGAQ